PNLAGALTERINHRGDILISVQYDRCDITASIRGLESRGVDVVIGGDLVLRSCDARHPISTIIAVGRPIPRRIHIAGETMVAIVCERSHALFRRSNAEQVATAIHHEIRIAAGRVSYPL